VVGGHTILASAFLEDANLVQSGKTTPLDVLLASSAALEDANVVIRTKTIPLSSFLAGRAPLSVTGNLGTAQQTQVGSIIASIGGFEIASTSVSSLSSQIGRPGENGSRDGRVFVGGAPGSLAGSLASRSIWTLVIFVTGGLVTTLVL
jgi:hypothetical protein